MDDWVPACALAETIGLAAAAGAARWGQALADQGRPWPATLGVVVLGGLVEGTALGVLQGRVLGRRWPRLSRARYAVTTLVVAGLGWAAGSAPSVMVGDRVASSGPPVVLVVLGGAGIGLVMGPLLGAAQALALRPVVRRPRRWILANAVAWPPAMAVIFAGASTPAAGWPDPVVVLWGGLTGLVAGTLLGAVTRPWLRRLDEAVAEYRVRPVGWTR